MNHLDLFSGIGGFALAARWAGLDTIGFCEIDPFCQKVLRKHWPDMPIHSDIKTLEVYPSPWHVKIDLITAGFPCQPFSVAGSKKGINDDRYLWPEVIRVVRECKPTWAILENVPGIISHLDTILEDLEKEGYDWRAFLIPAVAVGAPHKRERLWIIAYRNSERCNERFNNRKERSIQGDWEQYVEALQSEWAQFQPESWTTFNTQEWLGFTADTDHVECDKRAENNETESERLEREKSAAKTGDVIGNTNSISSEQADTRTVTESENWTAWSRRTRQSREAQTIFNWQKDQPPIPGVDDGLPNGVDRNKSLGNAIVPQIPYLFMRIIKELHTH